MVGEDGAAAAARVELLAAVGSCQAARRAVVMGRRRAQRRGDHGRWRLLLLRLSNATAAAAAFKRALPGGVGGGRGRSWAVGQRRGAQQTRLNRDKDSQDVHKNLLARGQIEACRQNATAAG